MEIMDRTRVVETVYESEFDGRPTRWYDMVGECARKRDLGMDEARELVHDRQERKRFARNMYVRDGNLKLVLIFYCGSSCTGFTH